MNPDEAIRMLLDYVLPIATQQPEGRLDIHDANSGAIIATIQVHDLPKRPREMPRRLRPKARLSKRQRDAAKRDKLQARA